MKGYVLVLPGPDGATVLVSDCGRTPVWDSGSAARRFARELGLPLVAARVRRGWLLVLPVMWTRRLAFDMARLEACRTEEERAAVRAELFR